MLYECCVSVQFSNWSGVFPQNPQDSPSVFNIGFWLAQVPANLPSFFAQILIAIPAKPKPNRPIVSNKSFKIVAFLEVQRYGFLEKQDHF